MKKLFTLIAAALMAVGAQAQQYIRFDGATYASPMTISDGDFKATLEFGTKGAIEDPKNADFIPWGQASADNAEKFTSQIKPGGAVAKLSGERSIVLDIPSNGDLYIYARTGTASATDRTVSVNQNGSEIFSEIIMEANSFVVPGDGEVNDKYYYWIPTCKVKKGQVNVLTSGSINFFGFKFVSDGTTDDPGTGGETVGNAIASYVQGTTTGTWAAVGVDGKTPDLAYSAKYNTNKTTTTVVTFPSSIISEGAWQGALKVAGEFKAGDVITIQPFTSMSNNDFTGGAKYANILLYSSDVKEIANLTGSAAGALTVTDGHEEAGDPKEFTYTLEKDYTDLYFGRGGNTRINLMKVTITRPGTSGINNVDANVNVNNNVVYNLAGQRVSNGFKGIVIKNGKKIVIK